MTDTLSSESGGPAPDVGTEVGPRHFAPASRRGALISAVSLLALGTAAYKVTDNDTRPPPVAGSSTENAQATARTTAVPSVASGAQTPPLADGQPGTLRLPANLDPVHLVQRVTYGPTPGLLTEVKRVGPAAWLEAQLSPTKVSDSTGDAILEIYPHTAVSMSEAKGLVLKNPENRRYLNEDLRRAHVARAVFSQCQLLV